MHEIYGLWHMCESEGVIDISHSFRPFKTQLSTLLQPCTLYKDDDKGQTKMRKGLRYLHTKA